MTRSMTQPRMQCRNADLGTLIGEEVVAADGPVDSARREEVRHNAGLAGHDACQRCTATHLSAHVHQTARGHSPFASYKLAWAAKEHQ